MQHRHRPLCCNHIVSAFQEVVLLSMNQTHNGAMLQVQIPSSKATLTFSEAHQDTSSHRHGDYHYLVIFLWINLMQQPTSANCPYLKPLNKKRKKKDEGVSMFTMLSHASRLDTMC